MNHPTPDQINNLVQSIIKDRLQDGQFSECDLTFKELQIVGKTLCETLNGIFHSRITYPEPPEDKERMSLLIDFIDETEEVKEEYVNLIREILEKQLKWKNRGWCRVISNICR